MSHNRLSYLFQRYYNAEATGREIEELMELVRKSKDDERLSALTKEVWDNLQESDQVFSEEVKDRILNSIVPFSRDEELTGEDYTGIVRYDSQKTIWWRKYSVAAAVALICVSGAWWKWNSDRKEKEGVAAGIQSDIKPGTNRAVLTLADGSVIQLDDVADGIISQQGATEISKVGDGRLMYNAAGSEGAGKQINVVSTPRGGQYQINLPDGTMVWLNASSSIKFPAGFAADERRVEIEGEVFFEVKKDVTRPFKVIFGGNEVEVLGTSFNIAHYPDEAVSRTTLVEGSVALKNGDKKNTLKPGQAASITKDGAVSVAAVDIEEMIAWKNGLFYFREAGIETIMQQVSRWYDIEVGYNGVLPEKQFTGKVRRSVNLSEFMAMLQYAGVNYRMEGRKMVLVR